MTSNNAKKEIVNLLIRERQIRRNIEKVRTNQATLRFSNNYNNNPRMALQMAGLNTRFRELRGQLAPLELRIFELERNHGLTASKLKGRSLLVSAQRIARKAALERRRRNARRNERRAAMRRALTVGAHHALPRGLLARFPASVRRPIAKKKSHPTTRSVTSLFRRLSGN
jgi:hypothetical protein